MSDDQIGRGRRRLGRRRDIVWVALVACALAVPAALADEAGTAGLKKDVRKALKQAKKAKQKANRANKRSKNALSVAEETSKQQGPKGDPGLKGDPGPQGPKGDPGADGTDGFGTLAYRVDQIDNIPDDDSDPSALFATATCPDGTFPVGGSAVVFDNGGNPVPDHPVAQAFSTPDGLSFDGWVGVADPDGGQNFSLDVVAACVNADNVGGI